MPRVGFAIEGEGDDSRPTMAVWLEGNGMSVQHFYCDKPFWISFEEDWPGEGKGGGPGGSGPGFVMGPVYYSGGLVGKKASIALRFADPTNAKDMTASKEFYKFSVKIDGVKKAWDPRVIPD